MATSTAGEPNPERYRSFLLRIWCEAPDRRWRASLEDPRSGKRIGFSGLEHLFVYLMEEVDGAAKTGSTESMDQDDCR